MLSFTVSRLHVIPESCCHAAIILLLRTLFSDSIQNLKHEKNLVWQVERDKLFRVCKFCPPIFHINTNLACLQMQYNLPAVLKKERKFYIHEQGNLSLSLVSFSSSENLPCLNIFGNISNMWCCIVTTPPSVP